MDICMHGDLYGVNFLCVFLILYMHDDDPRWITFLPLHSSPIEFEFNWKFLFSNRACMISISWKKIMMREKKKEEEEGGQEWWMSYQFGWPLPYPTRNPSYVDHPYAPPRSVLISNRPWIPRTKRNSMIWSGTRATHRIAIVSARWVY